MILFYIYLLVRCFFRYVDSVYVSFIILFFFFFQAEDGIRDLYVTGVQTCALPIYSTTTLLARAPMGSKGMIAPTGQNLLRLHPRPLYAGSNQSRQFSARHPLRFRSEERRVGKECRSRWARYHEKENESRERR